MSVDLITVENLSKDLLKTIFDDAYLTTTLEGDDDPLLYVEDGKMGCYVIPSDSKKEIRFAMYARIKEEVSRQNRLEAANKANNEWKAIRSVIHDNGRYSFEYYVFVNEGVSPKSLVLTLKTYFSFVSDMIYELDII